ncbi:MAG TPA: hypothetical protein VF865_06580 [Acidobacteriaceae bacterium]
MLSLAQRYLVIGMTALLLGYATTASAASMPDADKQLSDALEQAMPSVLSSQDYWSASKLYFQLAAARSRMKETAAACTALVQSLAYYRKALAKATGAPMGEAVRVSGNDEGLAEVRSKFGCTNMRTELSAGLETSRH